MAEDGDDNYIIIFATDENVKLLAEAETIYVDGTFCTDFKLALIQAAQLSFLGAEIRGCYYHFCQCINRRCNSWFYRLVFFKIVCHA